MSTPSAAASSISPRSMTNTDKDPLDSLTPQERNDIGQYLRSYHGFAMDSATTFRDIERVLPGVFEKISGTLECYVKALEEDSDLTE